MTKPLCELKKTLRKDLKAYLQLVKSPTHLCKKCGRMANSAELVCRPMKLKD